MTDTPLPAALRDLLAKARAKLKAGEAAKVTLTMSEVRAIYALSTQLHAARESRDKLRKELQSERKAVVKLSREARDRDLVQNRAVVALLIDVERLLRGEETSPDAQASAFDRLQRYIKRARNTDAKRAARRRDKPYFGEDA